MRHTLALVVRGRTALSGVRRVGFAPPSRAIPAKRLASLLTVICARALYSRTSSMLATGPRTTVPGWSVACEATLVKRSGRRQSVTLAACRCASSCASFTVHEFTVTCADGTQRILVPSRIRCLIIACGKIRGALAWGGPRRYRGAGHLYGACSCTCRVQYSRHKRVVLSPTALP